MGGRRHACRIHLAELLGVLKDAGELTREQIALVGGQRQPRQSRDALHFLPLPVVRPRTAAISGDAGWVQCLHDALRTARFAVNRGAVTAAVNDGAAAVARLLLQIVEKVRLPPELGGPAKPPTMRCDPA